MISERTGVVNRARNAARSRSAPTAGMCSVPEAEEMRAEAQAETTWLRERTGGKHARGTSVVPFSMHNIDEVLGDVGVDVSGATKAKQWLLPLNPSDYKSLTPKLAKKLAAS